MSINNQAVQDFNKDFLSFLNMTSNYQNIVDTRIVEEKVRATQKKKQRVKRSANVKHPFPTSIQIRQKRKCTNRVKTIYGTNDDSSNMLNFYCGEMDGNNLDSNILTDVKSYEKTQKPPRKKRAIMT